MPMKIPAKDATWSQVSKLTLSFNGYEELGDECGDIENATSTKQDSKVRLRTPYGDSRSNLSIASRTNVRRDSSS